MHCSLRFILTVLRRPSAIAIAYAVEQFSSRSSLSVFLFMFAGMIPLLRRSLPSLPRYP